MLRKRLIASVTMIIPVLGIFWLDTAWNFGRPGAWTAPVVLFFSLMITGELIAMTRERTAGAIPWVCYVGAVLCHLAVSLPLFSDPIAIGGKTIGSWEWSAFGLFLVVAMSFIHELLNFHEERQSTHRIAVTILVVLYSTWLLSFLTAMRISLGNYVGAIAMFSVLFIIKMSDAGAYFAGKRLGRNKLAPVLSPGKTVEGLVGGIIAAIAASAIVFALIMPNVVTDYAPNWAAVFGYALMISILGVVGDLSESLIKRDMRCKDSSGWLPGLGGIMDIADSVILAGPVAYLWWQTGWL